VKLPGLGGSVLTFLRMDIADGEVDKIVGTSPTIRVPSSMQEMQMQIYFCFDAICRC